MYPQLYHNNNDLKSYFNLVYFSTSVMAELLEQCNQNVFITCHQYNTVLITISKLHEMK